MNAAGLAARARHILLDFDGPVCAVFGSLPDHDIAERLRRYLIAQGYQIPPSLAQAHDPFEVLAHASTLGQDIAQAVEAQFRAAEAEAVKSAPQTPGLRAVLDHFTRNEQVVTIVSNNSTTAVETYLQRHDLEHYVTGISARTAADIDRLKPDPYLLRHAMRATGTAADECLMLGDSITDIQAAHAAGTPVVAYANKPGKRQRLAAHGPDAIIGTLTELITSSAAA